MKEQKQFVNRTIHLIKKYYKKIGYDEINTLEKLGVEELENSFSYVLKWLSETRDKNGNLSFLKELIDRIKKEAIRYADYRKKESIFTYDPKKITVELEKQDKTNRADLVIYKNKKIWFVIENKVWSTEHKNKEGWQTVRYAKSFLNDNSFGIFLTIDGVEAKSSQFIAIDYSMISSILKKLLKKNIYNKKDNHFIEDFNNNLEKNILHGNFNFLKELDFLQEIMEAPRMFELIMDKYADLYKALIRDLMLYFINLIDASEKDITPSDNRGEYKEQIKYKTKNYGVISISICYNHDEEVFKRFKWQVGQLFVLIEGKEVISNLKNISSFIYMDNRKNDYWNMYLIYDKDNIPSTEKERSSILKKLEEIYELIAKL
jgi:hypothetical protein